MSDDIVTRLRDRLEESFCHCVKDPFFVCSYCAIEEAADEIERLRKDRHRWLNIAFCTHCLPQHDHYCVEHSQDEDGRLPNE